ncbi:MAG: hypothetical protein CVT73_04690 [Alphaproteobacteria bacterium HGW-Alphaproteobacteria-12]|nr:MAG: hypothetical protein CVT73_04690 [Alphaproteobacteria bacterium HGW-Alphaproteobacteria-12]
MNKIFKQWLHEAALAAELFTGQPHWYGASQDRASAGRVADTPRMPAAPPDERDFTPALRAAD